MLYRFLKYSIAFGLYLFHKKIEVHGLEHIPKDKPVLFLPNHQNALIDVLLIATNCNRTPYFLSRSDVFRKSILRTFFKYLKMIPVYRMRDGRDTVTQNHEIFDTCAQLLQKGEAITMFPEANHSLQRRVRLLSKGFTRVLFKALEDAPALDVVVVPVGLNYQHASLFPDAVAVYYGKPIAIQELYDADDLVASALILRNTVTSSLKELTTHVEPESKYKEISSYLEDRNTNFLNPTATNNSVKNWNGNSNPAIEELKKPRPVLNIILHPLYLLINLPVLTVWRLLIKPKVWEPEFMGTLRFATALLGFLIYLSIVFILFYSGSNIVWAIGIVVFVIVFNWIYVKQIASK